MSDTGTSGVATHSITTNVSKHAYTSKRSKRAAHKDGDEDKAPANGKAEDTQHDHESSGGDVQKVTKKEKRIVEVGRTRKKRKSKESVDQSSEEAEDGESERAMLKEPSWKRHAKSTRT